MKKLLPLLILPVVIFLFSCKKNNQAIASVLITGKWNIIADTTTRYVNGKLSSKTLPGSNAIYIQFNDDGTGAVFYNTLSYSESLTYSQAKSLVTFNGPPPPDQDNAYSTLTSMPLTIVSITNNTLKLSYTHSSTTNGTLYAVNEVYYLNR